MMQAHDFPVISHSPKRWAEFVRTRTPIHESIVQLDSRGRRDWRLLRNEELAAHAIWRLADMGINGRGELAKVDSGLYEALRGRKLLVELELEEKLRNWAGMEREELVAHAKGFIAANGIMGRGELRKANRGLYRALGGRKLLDEVGLEKKHRNWAGMERDELVAHAKGFIAERGIGGRGELAKADSGLYRALVGRKLLDEVGLPDSNDKYRDWAGMGKEELIAHAKGFIAERGIGGRRELAKADSGLYDALRRRKLRDEIGLSNSNKNDRDWAGMERDELVAYSKKFIAERGIIGREELAKADRGLYDALRKRKLLDAVFSEVDSSNHKEAVDGVLVALESFGDGK